MTDNAHGGPNRGQGRKPLPPDQKKRRHTVYLSPGSSDKLKAMAELSASTEGRVIEQLLEPTEKGCRDFNEVYLTHKHH